jgi:hypothetical protein
MTQKIESVENMKEGGKALGDEFISFGVNILFFTIMLGGSAIFFQWAIYFLIIGGVIRAAFSGLSNILQKGYDLIPTNPFKRKDT